MRNCGPCQRCRIKEAVSRLRSLQLTNFRSFANDTLDVADATVIVGPNNAGKTTVIEALSILLDADFLDTSGVSVTALRGAATDQPIQVVGRFALDERDRTYWQAALRDDGCVHFAYVERLASRCVWIPKSAIPDDWPAGEEWPATVSESADDAGLWLDVFQY